MCNVGWEDMEKLDEEGGYGSAVWFMAGVTVSVLLFAVWYVSQDGVVCSPPPAEKTMYEEDELVQVCHNTTTAQWDTKTQRMVAIGEICVWRVK